MTVLRLLRLCAVLALALGTRAALAGETRMALVIGEADYRAGPLATPANDAGAMAQALAQAGFAVTGYTNLDGGRLRRAFDDFVGKARDAGPAAVIVVYLAGYGLQYDGDNYIVPVDARPPRDTDLPARVVRLADLVQPLGTLPARGRVLIFDLARFHPFARPEAALAGGLAPMEPPVGSTIAFNTAPGFVAPAGQGTYGHYASALAEGLAEPGGTLETLLPRARLRAVHRSGGALVPWNAGTLPASIRLFAAGTPASPATPPTDTPPADTPWAPLAADTLPVYLDWLKAHPEDAFAPRIRLLAAARREAETWAQTRRTDRPDAYWTYMRRYPRGPHFGDIRRRLAALAAPLEPPPRFALVPYADLAPPKPDELELLAQPFPSLDGAGALPAPSAGVPADDRTFQDRPAPLLAVGAAMLPLSMPVPLGFASGPAGRIEQPGLGGPDMPVTAQDGLDAAGAPVVTQTDPGGRVLSAARIVTTAEGRRIEQTGPDVTIRMTAPATSRLRELSGAAGKRPTILPPPIVSPPPPEEPVAAPSVRSQSPVAEKPPVTGPEAVPAGGPIPPSPPARTDQPTQATRSPAKAEPVPPQREAMPSAPPPRSAAARAAPGKPAKKAASKPAGKPAAKPRPPAKAKSRRR